MNRKSTCLSNPTFDSYSFYLKLLSYILIAIFLLFFNTRGYSAQVTLAWDPSNQADLKGFRIYYGTASGSYQWTIDAGNVTTYKVTGLNIGATYYAAATAYNTSGVESTFSNEVMFTVPGCTYSISPSTASFPPTGGAGTVNITTSSYCTWTASSNASWVTVGVGSGQGNGSISYTVSPNNNTASQTASLAIAGNTFMVTEAGRTQTIYTITASQGTGGTISPIGQIGVLSGGGQNFTITPNSGYRIADVTVDGVSQGPIDVYTFTGVTKNHTIYASFSSISGPPRATTKPSSFNGRGSISLNGYVNPNDLSTTCHFEWGLTAAYGNSTQSQNITDGNSDLPVTADLNGLNPEAIYHFRLVAMNSAGTSYGGDQTFRASNSSRDFNNDGNTDILWRNKVTGGVVVWYMNGAGAVSKVDWIVQDGDTSWEIVGTGDFNNDGNTDILWRNKATGGVVAWYMNGAGAASKVDWISQDGDTNWEIVGTGEDRKSVV
jgi:hypothetical protein